MSNIPNATPTSIYERRLALSPKELARRYGVSLGLIRLEITRGKLRALRIGRRVVIPMEAVEEWLVAAK
jgi:excisionase family DNA binding protein